MAEPRDLPDGWVKVWLGEVRLNKGINVVPLQEPHTFFELYSVPSYSIGSPEILSGQDIGSSKQTVIPNTVLISKINPYINRVWVVNGFSQYRQIASLEWISFFPISGLYPKYLSYFLQQNNFREYLASNVFGVGGSLTRTNTSVVDRYEFLLPPLLEQRRIVQKLEELFAELDTAEEALRSALEGLKEYRRSVLESAVTGELSKAWRKQNKPSQSGAQLLKQILLERRKKWEEKQQVLGRENAVYEEPISPDTNHLPKLPSGWVYVTTGQIAVIETGATPLRTNSNYYQNGTIPWVTSGALNNLYIYKTSEFITSLALEETNAKIFPVRTLLIAMYGEGKTRGMVSELKIEAATNQACAALIFDTSTTQKIQPFMKIFFQKSYDDLRKLAGGGVQPNLNLSIIKSTLLPMPPLAEQSEIVTVCTHILEEAANLDAKLRNDLARNRQMRQAILEQAFAGQLVPQDPTDEPASELLKRIQAEKKAALEEEKMKRSSKPKTKSVENKAVPSLLEVLRAADNPLTPEEVFRAAGYTHDSLEVFYADLKTALNNNLIRQVEGSSGSRDRMLESTS